MALGVPFLSSVNAVASLCLCAFVHIYALVHAHACKDVCARVCVRARAYVCFFERDFDSILLFYMKPAPRTTGISGASMHHSLDSLSLSFSFSHYSYFSSLFLSLARF